MNRDTTDGGGSTEAAVDKRSTRKKNGEDLCGVCRKKCKSGEKAKKPCLVMVVMFGITYPVLKYPMPCMSFIETRIWLN